MLDDAPSYTHEHTHTPTLMGSMCHIIMVSRVVGQRIMWGDASVLVGCSTLAGQPLVTFASEAARAVVHTCAGRAFEVKR